MRVRIAVTAFGLLGYHILAQLPLAELDSSLAGAFGDEALILRLAVVFLTDTSLSDLSFLGLGLLPALLMRRLSLVLDQAGPEARYGRLPVAAGTFALSLLLGWLYYDVAWLNAESAESIASLQGGVKKTLVVVALAIGGLFTKLLCDVLTRRGLGDGLQLVATFNATAYFHGRILASSPNIAGLVAVGVGILGLGAVVVFLQRSQRRVPVQYAKHALERRLYSRRTTYIPVTLLPFDVNLGVVPVLAVSWILTSPLRGLAQSLGLSWYVETVVYLKFDTWPGKGFFALVLLFVTFLWQSITRNPADLAQRLHASEGFIPGIRAGKRTADYLDRIGSRLALAGWYVVVLTVIGLDLLLHFSWESAGIVALVPFSTMEFFVIVSSALVMLFRVLNSVEAELSTDPSHRRRRR